MFLYTSFNRDPDGLSPAETADYGVTLTNPGFETGDTTGWTVSRETVNVTGSDEGLTPRSGSYFVTGVDFHNEDFAIIEQQVSLTGAGVPTSALDDGSLKAVLRWWQANSVSGHLGMALLRFLDGSDVRVGVDSGPEAFEVTPTDTWEEQTLEVQVPIGARKAVVYLCLKQEGGGYPKVGFDDVSLALEADDLTPETRTAAVVYFRSTTASPPGGLNEALGSSPSIADLEDEDGNSTGWSLSTQAPFNSASDEGYYGTMGTSPLVPGPVSLLSGWIRSSITITGVLRIGGLDTGATYDVAVFPSIDSGGTQTIDVTLDGASSNTIRGDAERNLNTLVLFEGIAPDGSGNLDLTVDSVSSYGHVSAIKIWESGTA